MFAEHEKVELVRDLPDEKLKAKSVGFVVHVFKKPAGYAVEFEFDDEMGKWVEHKVVNVTPDMISRVD